MVAVGDATSGKSSLLSALKDGKIPDSSVPEIFETFSLKIKVDGRKVELGLWDTSGEDEYEALRRLSYPNCDVFIVCYSVGSRNSFERVRTKWLPEVRKYRPTTPFVIVGTKRDLRPQSSLMRDGSGRDSKDGFVNFDEGMMLANDLGACSFLECSALGGNGVKEVFEEASRAAFKGDNEEKLRSKSGQGRSNSLFGKLMK